MAKKVRLILEITDNGLRFLWVNSPPVWRGSKSHDKGKCDWIPLAKSGSISQTVREYLANLISSSPKSPQLSYPIPTLLLLPFSNGFLREFKIPPLSGYKLAQTVKYLIEEEVPLPSGDRTYDFVKLSDGKVLIGAIRRSALDSIAEELKRAGLKVIKADFALSGLIHLLSLANGEAALYINRNESALDFGVFRGNTPEFFKTLKTSQGNWEQEFYRQIRYYQTEHHDAPIKRIFAESKQVQELAKELVNTGIGEEWIESLEGQIEDIPAHMRWFLNGQKGSLNLLREVDLEYKLKSARKIPLGMTFAGLIIGMLFSWRVYTMANEARLEVNLLETELSQVEQGISKDIKKWEEWMGLHEKSEELGVEMAELLKLVPKGIKADEVELTGSTLFFAGSAMRGTEVQGLMSVLKHSGWTEVALLRFSQQGEGEIQFVLSSSRKGKRG